MYKHVTGRIRRSVVKIAKEEVNEKIWRSQKKRKEEQETKKNKNRRYMQF